MGDRRSAPGTNPIQGKMEMRMMWVATFLALLVRRNRYFSTGTDSNPFPGGCLAIFEWIDLNDNGSIFDRGWAESLLERFSLLCIKGGPQWTSSCFALGRELPTSRLFG